MTQLRTRPEDCAYGDYLALANGEKVSLFIATASGDTCLGDCPTLFRWMMDCASFEQAAEQASRFAGAPLARGGI